MTPRSLEERIAALSKDARALLVQRLEHRAREHAAPGTHSQQLVAYYEAREDEPPPDPAELRRVIAERLPPFMVPSRFVQLASLPLLPNGKIDRRSLASRRDERRSTPPPAPARPDQDDRARLLGVWREVLGLASVGLEDDFFELGGDSILAMRLISGAGQAGFGVTLGEFFRAPTPSGMLAAARGRTSSSANPLPHGSIGTSGRPVPLTPIQHWFFEQDFAGADRWNQALTLEIPSDTDHARLETAMRAVVANHEALRLSVVRKGGGWQQHLSTADTHLRVPCVEVVERDPDPRGRLLARESDAADRAMRLDSGVLLRAVRFRLQAGDRRSDPVPQPPDLLYLTAHHLAVDLVSWGVITDDLEMAYRQLESGEEVGLPSPATSFSGWADALHLHAQAAGVRKESTWWTSRLRSVPPLPRDFTGAGANDEASADVVHACLSPELTGGLFDGAGGAHRGVIPGRLLTAVVHALARWSSSSTFAIGIEGHGRVDVVPGLDVSRTVGWFTSYCPVVFDLRAGRSLPAVLRVVNERLRELPGHELGYGVLRYLTADARLTEQLSALPAPEVAFNYAGRITSIGSGHRRFRAVPNGFRTSRDPAARRPAVIEINAHTASDGLNLAFGYSRNVHRRDTIDRLADWVTSSMASLTAASTTDREGRASPSDFPDAGLDQDELDTLLGSM